MRAGTLVVDIAANVARLQQDMSQAKGVVQGAMKEITSSVNTAKSAIAALGVGLSVQAVASMVLGINKTVAALDDMAEVTGTAVEELSKLQVVAKVGGHDFGLVEDSLVKLTKGLKGTEEETKNARSALEQLGIKAKTAGGQQRDAGEIMREVSAKFALYGDNAAKTAFALDIFGKSGAKLLPFLKDMAEEGTVSARVTAEQAAQAEKLEKAFARLMISGEDARRNFLLPWIDDAVEFAKKLTEAQKAADGLIAGLATMATAGTGDRAGRLRVIDKEITQAEASARAADKVANIPFLGGFAGVGAAAEKVRVGRLVAERQYLLSTAPTSNAAEEMAMLGVSPLAPRALTRKPPPEAAKGKSLEDLLQETSGLDKDFYKDLATLHGGYASGTITLDRYRLAVEALLEKQKFAKDLTKQHADAVKSLTESAKLQADQDEQQAEILANFNTVASTRVQQLEFENGLIESGASITARTLGTKQEALALEIQMNATREKAIAFRQIDLDLEKQMVDATPETVGALYERAAAEKERLGVAIDAKAAKEQARGAAETAAGEWKQAQVSMWQSLDRTAHDTWVSITDGGKDAAQRIKESFKNLLFDFLYQAAARPLIFNVAANVSGGGVAQSAFGGSGGGLGGMNPLSMMNNANSLFGGGGYGNLAMGLGNTLGIGVGYNAAAIGGAMGVSELGLVAGGASSVGAGGALAAGVGAEMGGAAAAGALAAEGGAGLMAAGSMAGPIGMAIAAIAMIAMSGMDDDKRKLPELGIVKNDWGGYRVGQMNVEGGDNNLPIYAALNKAINDPKQYDQSMLGNMTGYLSGERGESAQSMLGRLAQWLAPAAEAAQWTNTLDAMRDSLKLAKDPLAFWTSKVKELGGDLGTAATSTEQWRDQFMAALDGTLTQEQLTKWQDLGQAIERAGNALAPLATSAFSTLVDYKRAMAMRRNGIPGFAAGGLHAGGWRVVGEGGPELEFTPPSTIVNNAESRSLLGMPEMVNELRALRGDLTNIQIQNARRDARMASLYKRWDATGMPVRGSAGPDAPVPVQAV